MNHQLESTRVFKHNRARKNVIVGGAIILVCITLLSCVSSYMIYREGFADLPELFQNALAFFAVVVVEGAFIWLVYGFTRAFASSLERLIAFVGMCFLVGVMLTNIVTHFMMVKRLPLNPIQDAWLAWGAVTVFIAVLVVVLAITLADPVTRLIRLELRYLGRQQEVILEAKHEGLDSPVIRSAMTQRADAEAEILANQVLGGYLPAGKVESEQQTPAQPRRVGFPSRAPGRPLGPATARRVEGDDQGKS